MDASFVSIHDSPRHQDGGADMAKDSKRKQSDNDHQTETGGNE